MRGNLFFSRNKNISSIPVIFSAKVFMIMNNNRFNHENAKMYIIKRKENTKISTERT